MKVRAGARSSLVVQSPTELQLCGSAALDDSQGTASLSSGSLCDVPPPAPCLWWM